MQHVDAGLDRNHSHFILAANTTMGEHQYTKLRCEFEACVAQNHCWPQTREYIEGCMHELDLEWPDLDHQAKEGGEEGERISTQKEIPVINVSVQGGHESIQTILNSVNEQLPVLLVRGTGKATDLVADAVCLKFAPGHAKHLNRDRLSHRQKTLFNFLEDLRLRSAEVLVQIIKNRHPLERTRSYHDMN